MTKTYHIHLSKGVFVTNNLRLLLHEHCNKDCPMCVNKDWDLDALEKEEDYSSYDMILMTGGEPMLYPYRVIKAVERIREQTDCPIIMYTAFVDKIPDVLSVLEVVDGITVTLHEQKDMLALRQLDRVLDFIPQYQDKSFRLNVFKGIWIPKDQLEDRWKIQDDMVWIKNCPLPKNEVFKKY